MPTVFNAPFQLPHVYGNKECTGVASGYTLAAAASWLVTGRAYFPVQGAKRVSLSGQLKPDNGGNATLQFAVNLAGIVNPAVPNLSAADMLIVETDAFAGAATGYYGFLLNIYADQPGYFGLYPRSAGPAAPIYEGTFAFCFGSAYGLRLNCTNKVGSQTVSFEGVTLGLGA